MPALGFGLDIYVTNVVTIGANLTGDALFLKRPTTTAADHSLPSRATHRQDEAQQTQRVYQNDGTSIGAGMTATGVVGLHF